MRTCAIGFSLDSYYDEQKKREIESYIEENEFLEHHHEAICKFYENGLSWSVAEAMAKMWAKNMCYYEWDNPEVVTIAKKLDLDWIDAYAILGDRENFKKEKEKN